MTTGSTQNINCNIRWS